MSNYFDNKNNRNYRTEPDDKGSVKITVDHGSHKHTFDIGTSDPRSSTWNQGLGDLHRATSHDPKPNISGSNSNYGYRINNSEERCHRCNYFICQCKDSSSC